MKFYVGAGVKYLVIICSLFVLSCCGQGDGQKIAGLQKSDFAQLARWEEEDHATALSVFARDCGKIFATSRFASFVSSDRRFGTSQQWLDACHRAGGDDAKADPRAFFEQNFTPYKIYPTSADSPKPKFTGYYTPMLRASATKTEQYRHPIYSLPKAPKARSCNGYTRADINAGALGRQEPILYMDDVVERFFLHVQGSALVKLEDGRMGRLVFAGKNGCEYRSIGQYVMSQGWWDIDEGMSAPAFKYWLKKQTEQRRTQVLHHNASYIYFDFHETGEVGDHLMPSGAAGVKLTPMRSLAVDNRAIPYGVPLWVETKVPAFGHNLKTTQQGFNHVMIAHDTGSAIKGAVRGDIFFGTGDSAGMLAGHMNARGGYYALIPSR